MTPPPTAYQLKRAALYPRIIYGRYRERNQSEFMKNALELCSYSRSAYDFIGARMENNDILYDVALGPDQVGLDVGAYVGKWATAVCDRTAAGVVHSFELSPAIIPELTANVADNPRIIVHDVGLGGADTTVRISRRGLGSSVYERAGDDFDEGVIRDIAAVWQELGLDQVAVMKINIEGGEYDLLERMAETGLIDRVDTFLIQFHEWIPGSYRRRRGIRRTLARTHDEVWDYPFVWERWQRRTAASTSA